MSKALVVVDPNASVIKAQILLKDHDISHLPVMDEEKLLGIITKGDLFRVLVPLTGAGKKGMQFVLLLEDRCGAIKEITDIIRKNGGRIMSVLTSYDDAPKGSLKLYLRKRDFSHSLKHNVEPAVLIEMKIRTKFSDFQTTNHLYPQPVITAFKKIDHAGEN